MSAYQLGIYISASMSSWISSFKRRPAAPHPDAQHPEEEKVDGNKGILSHVMSLAQDESLFTRLTSTKHREATRLWSKLCHKVDAAYPPKDQLQPLELSRTNGTNDDDQHHLNDHTLDGHGNDNEVADSSNSTMDDTRYSLRHAFCAYHPTVVALKSEEISLAFKSQTAMLAACFNLSADDILIDRCSLKMDNLMTKVHEPAHYLAVDHRRKVIVLSIRGTSSIGDIVTDLNAKCAAHSISGITGFVHEGMLQSAQFLYKSVTNSLVTACHRYGDYKVVITGHSLGAGVAALLGLMYREHPVVFGGNGCRLRVWCFASPCIVSREFTDQQLGNGFITSVALETDVVTRLSMESVRKCNLRQDFIMTHCRHSPQMMHRVLHRHQMEAESEGAEFLRILKTLKSPNPKQELFPLGRILWFVPRIVMDDDIVFRRKTLMKMFRDDHGGDGDGGGDGGGDMVEEMGCDEEEGLEADKEEVVREELEGKEENEDVAVPKWRRKLSASMRNLNANPNQVFREIAHDIGRGVRDFQTDIRCKMDTSRRRRKYGGGNYVLCEATQCRYMFQEFVFEFPASLKSHNPQRYLWACDATLREPTDRATLSHPEG